MPPTISVVIPAFNAARYVDACLDSVFSQSGDFKLEVIVVDDGSTDDTVRCLERRPGVRLHRQAQRGPSAARNIGIAMAIGEYVAFLDVDDLWPPGSLNTRFSLMTRYPDAGLAFGDCRQFDEAGPHPDTVFGEGGYDPSRFGHQERVPRAYAQLFENNFITTGSVLAKTALLKELGGFDENLRFVEDMDLWLRIAARYPIVYSSQICLLRRLHDQNTSRNAEEMSYAYLKVLERQTQVNRDAIENYGVSLRRCYALEYADQSIRALTVGQRTRAMVLAVCSLSWALTRRGLAALADSFLPARGKR